MSGNYFTHDTIDAKSREMLLKLQQYRIVRQFDFVPEHSALLIIDMQRYFLDESSHAYVPSAEPIIPRIKKLAAAFNERKLPVILTRHLNTKEDAKVMAQWWADLITEDNELSEIFPDLHIPGTTIIRKTQYDAFHQTHLEEMLKEKGISQLVITGVLTHICCETTARSAFVKGFKVFFPIDGTAAYSEEFHWSTLLNLSYGFAVPVLMEKIQRSVETFKSGR